MGVGNRSRRSPISPSTPAAQPAAEPDRTGAAAVALGAVAAPAALLAHRRRVNGRRLLHDDPEPADLPYDFGGPPRSLLGGFLAADTLRLARQRAHGVETDKVPVTATRLRRALPEAEREAALAEAADVYRGELLADGCPDWGISLQEEYRARALDARARAAALAICRGDHATVERYRRALALDPINEEVAANLARALHQTGDHAGVTRLRTALVEALRRELDDPDAEPQPETQEVFDAIAAELAARRARVAA